MRNKKKSTRRKVLRPSRSPRTKSKGFRFKDGPLFFPLQRLTRPITERDPLQSEHGGIVVPVYWNNEKTPGSITLKGREADYFRRLQEEDKARCLRLFVDHIEKTKDVMNTLWLQRRVRFGPPLRKDLEFPAAMPPSFPFDIKQDIPFGDILCIAKGCEAVCYYAAELCGVHQKRYEDWLRVVKEAGSPVIDPMKFLRRPLVNARCLPMPEMVTSPPKDKVLGNDIGVRLNHIELHAGRAAELMEQSYDRITRVEAEFGADNTSGRQRIALRTAMSIIGQLQRLNESLQKMV